MKDLNSKIKNQNGVSILFAMLLFLVVSLVSITVIASSYTSAKTINTTSKGIQENVSLDSAALFIKNELSKTKYQCYKKDQWWEDSSCEYSDYYTTVDNYFKTDIVNISKAYSNFMNDKNYDKVDNFKEAFTIYPTINSDDQILDNVNVSYKYSFDKNYSIVTFKLETDSGNKCYLEFSLSYSKSQGFKIENAMRDFYEIKYTFVEARNMEN